MIEFGEQTDKHLAQAYHSHGWAYTELGKYDRALEDLGEAVRLDPNETLIHGLRGFVYRSLGEYVQAFRSLKYVIRLDGTPQIRFFQDMLKKADYYIGAIDGVYNPETQTGLIICAHDPSC